MTDNKLLTNGWYECRLITNDVSLPISWAYQMLGKPEFYPTGNWCWGSVYGGIILRFKNPDDALMFTLKFGL